MVLKNSKWDQKAKRSYMKKHGIAPSRPASDTPKAKWSSKRADAPKNPSRIALEDSDSEWDSDTDEALLNHFYPQLGDAELTKEQKVKIKANILAEMEKTQEEEGKEYGEEETESEPIDGIYLGSEKSQERDAQKDSEPQTVNLKELLRSATTGESKRSRKMLKNKMSDNFLEEYGLDSYSAGAKDDDFYNKKKFQISDLPADKLDGFKIGSALETEARPQPKKMSEQEIKEEQERQEKAEQNRLYHQIRNKFNPNGAPQNKGKVLEINNIDVSNKQHVSALNNRIAAHVSDHQQSSTTLEEDLDYLLGGSLASHEQPQQETDTGDLDQLLKGLSVESSAKTQAPKVARPVSDDDFLDQLLN